MESAGDVGGGAVAMRLYLCLHVPEFPAQALLRLRPELRMHAFAVMEGERPFERVISRPPQATAVGLGLGINRAEAEAYGVPLLRRSVAEEAAAREALISALVPYTPAVEDHSTATDCILVIDLTGTERLLGPLAEAAGRIRGAVREAGFSARLVTSANVHTALCLARTRFRQTIHVLPGEEAAALAALPLAVLALEEEQAATFQQWGVRLLGELAGLPEIELIASLGQAGSRLRQLARGVLPHLFQPTPVAFALTEFLEFDFPAELLEPLLFTLNTMLEQLLARAASRALALASVTVECGHEKGEAHRRSLRPSLPTADRALLLKLLQLDLQAHPPEAAVVWLRLSAEPGPESKVQIGLFSPQLPESARLEVTLARLAAVVGEDRVGQAVLADSHQDGEFAMKPFVVPAIRPTALPGRAPTTGLRRLRPAATVHVSLMEARLSGFWHEGRRYEVRAMSGPWRSSGGWWAEQVWSAERWDVTAAAADGTVLVGVVAHDQRRQQWQLEAVYD